MLIALRTGLSFKLAAALAAFAASCLIAHLAALSSAKANGESSAELAGKLTETGAINKLDHARRQVFASEIQAQVTAANAAEGELDVAHLKEFGLQGLPHLCAHRLPRRPS
jgi:hypothetical protein